MSFSQEASKNLKEIPCYLSKICKSLPEHLILSSISPGCLSLSSSRLYSTTRQYLIKEHLILLVCPDFVLSRTPQMLWQKHTSEHLFYKKLPRASFKYQLFFLKREKQKQFFIPRLSFLRSKSYNCIKIKILFIHNSEKTTPIYLPFFCNIKYEKLLYLCFLLLRLHFPLNFLQTSLIIKDIIKHENKFNRKVFHDRENSENQFSEFSYFMKGFKKYIMDISW